MIKTTYGKFEIFRDKAGSFRWRLKAANGKVCAQSESYTRHFDARRACSAVLAASIDAVMVDLVAVKG